MMDEVEAREQKRALQDVLSLYSLRHRFKAEDICLMHKIWLGGIYQWAGQYRHVNLTKGTFPFAAAERISDLMAELERKSMRQFTPCLFKTQADVVHALAVVHTELVLIHPFREGNGRVARMLAIVMATQAGMDYNYEPMEEIFAGVIKRTLR